MTTDTKTYLFFLNEWNCKYTRVTLEKWTADKSGLIPILPRTNHMFVHWIADDNEEHWRDIYEVPLTVTECPCCASCWRKYGRPCTTHLFNGDSPVYDNKLKPIKVVGFDFVTYMDYNTTFEGDKFIYPADSLPDYSTRPRRSSRVKKQTDFYYGF